ncbi:hypothetical protein AAG906_006098 [Vitis piasezkii]
MGILHSGRKLIVDKGIVKASPMPSLKDIEALMVDIDDIEEFKWVFLIFTCATLLAPTSRLEDEGQPSSSHEHVNESGAPFDANNAQHSPVHSGGQRPSFEDSLGCTNEGVLERPHVEEGMLFANKDHLHPGPHNMLVLVQSCMDNNVDITPQAS